MSTRVGVAVPGATGCVGRGVEVRGRATCVMWPTSGCEAAADCRVRLGACC